MGLLLNDVKRATLLVGEHLVLKILLLLLLTTGTHDNSVNFIINKLI
jgi:hypothetical protein